MSKLSFLDFAFLALETTANPKHVAGLAIFDPGTGGSGSGLHSLLERMKAVDPAPPFNQKLEFPLLSMPRWVEDEEIDIDWHVRHLALPESGSFDDLMLLVSQMHATVLDRSRPLWEFYLIEGLEDKKFATYFKVHHAYMDGISMSKRVINTLNTSADDTALVPVWGSKSVRPKMIPEESRLLGQLAGGLKGAGLIAKSIPELGGLAMNPWLKALGLKKQGLTAPFTAPRTRLNEPLTAARSAATARLAIADIRSVATAANATVNDVLLTLCDCALSAYLDKTGGRPDRPLIAQMPISVRRDKPGGAGNQITIALVELSSGNKDPVARLREITERTAEVKNQYGRMSEFAATSYTILVQSLAQVADVTKVSRVLPPLGNVLISNVIGPKEELFMDGAKLVGLFPISAMPPGVSLNVTFYSTAGVVGAGIIAGREAIADATLIGREIENGLKDLSRSLTRTGRKKTGGTKKRQGV